MRSTIRKGPATDHWPRWGLTAGLVLSTALSGIAGEPPGGVPAVRSENPRAANVIFIRDRTRDAGELKSYSPKASASLDGTRSPCSRSTGARRCEGVVIVRFPSFAEAKAWYDSPAYRTARKHRLKGADYRAILVEGR